MQATLFVSVLLAIIANIVLPSGWSIERPPGPAVRTGTMPQGMSPSPNGAFIAVVESGYAAPSVSIYLTGELTRIHSIPLPGAFGRPLWIDDNHVLVAGANDDSLLSIDVSAASVTRIPLPAKSYPVALVRLNRTDFAVATDGDSSIRIGDLQHIGHAKPVPVGGRLGNVAATADGSLVFVSVWSGKRVQVIDTHTHRSLQLATRLHPGALLVSGDVLFVAETDADTVARFSTKRLALEGRTFVGDIASGAPGVSPNALFARSGCVFVSLGAANAVAILRNDSVVARVAAGRYPTDVFEDRTHLYVLDGKGEGTQPNPAYRVRRSDDSSYVAKLERGSLREYESPIERYLALPPGAEGWRRDSSSSPVRPHGPIRHVFFILKENRSYDQVLGDIPTGNGDSHLAWFGARVTPNEHAIALQYGLLDNAYASGEVSAAGHLWADAAFANDYTERTWPAMYGNRREDDLSGGDGARVPSGGYIWDAARRSHVSFRDYGELIDDNPRAPGLGTADVPSLRGSFDPRYVGWNLDYSDLAREAEWARDFRTLVAAGTLPSFELIWMPNDHTYGSKTGKPTPAAYVAMNDLAVGRLVSAISHSRVWKSSAIFITEDDAQDGPDHVSDQRTTVFVVSPYARGGVTHQHYSTVSILRTVEIMLGIHPLSIYDATAIPMYDAFTSQPRNAPFDVRKPRIDLAAANRADSFAAKLSATLDFSSPDRVDGRVMRKILTRNHAY